MESLSAKLKEYEEKLKKIKTLENPKDKKTYKCLECKDTGVVILNNNFARQCKCAIEKAKEKRMGKLLEFANIPVEFEGLTFDDFKLDVYSKENQNDIEAIRNISFNYVKNFKENKEGKGLYFYSKSPGTGKTLLSLIIGNSLMKFHEVSVRYTTISDLTETLKANFGNGQVSNKEILDSFSSVELLILDDIGQENSTRWTEEQLFSILDKRQDYKKPTIFTSNLKINELPYQERMKSRLRRIVFMGELEFPNEDIRKQIASEEDSEFAKLLIGG